MLKNKYLTLVYIMKAFQAFLNKLENYCVISCFNSILNISNSNFKLYLLNTELSEISAKCYTNYITPLKKILKDFYDDREETEKDVWYYHKIKGVRTPASDNRGTLNSIDFRFIPEFYRETVKRYFRSFITKKSISHCQNTHKTIKAFFNIFYDMGYTDGFLKEITRIDIEKYLYKVTEKYKNKNVTYVNKFIAYPRTFLEYIQLAQYDTAPRKEISFLIFQDDIPKRERDNDRLKRVKFIPEPILKQLDNNIMNLDRPQYVPVYILLRETGWRGTDILNLRYYNCLEQIWNSREQQYNYYLCGEITKTGIA
jgi:hypothetical protein